MIGHAVGQAVGQGGWSRRSVGQRFMTGYDRPMTDHDRPLPSLGGPGILQIAVIKY